MLTIREQLEADNERLLWELKLINKGFEEIIEENKKIIWALTIPEWFEFSRYESRILNNNK